MSTIPTAEELFITQNTGEQGFKIGTVSALFSGGDPQIKFDGETTASEKHYAYLSSYTPTASDRVLLAAVSGTYVILGKIV